MKKYKLNDNFFLNIMILIYIIYGFLSGVAI